MLLLQTAKNYHYNEERVLVFATNAHLVDYRIAYGIVAMSCRLSKEEFGLAIEEALKELPPEFAKVMETVRVEVRDRPTPKMLHDAGVGRGHTLLGLYHGRPATRRSVEDSGALPDVIYLFQCELEQTTDDPDQLRLEIRSTVLHEIGHHFGLDERDLHRLGYG